MKNRISLLWEYHCVRHSAVSILRHNKARNDAGGRAYPSYLQGYKFNKRIKKKKLLLYCTVCRAAPFYVGWSPAPVCTLQTLDMLKMTILTILKFTTLK